MAPEHPVLELTQDLVMRDPIRMMDVVTRLRDLGLEPAFDDFGTGRGSLGHLHADR